MSFLPNWGARNTVHAYHSKNTVKLPIKTDAPNEESTSIIPFAEFIRQNVPELKQDYKYWLKPWLFNGTLQSLYVSKADFSQVYKVYYGREIMTITDEISKEYINLKMGEITADYVINPLETSKAEFQAKYQETLPEGYPKLHPRTRYLTESEQSTVFKEWSDNDKPIVIIQHGLAGGSHEPAIRAVAQSLFEGAANVVVLNSRGCCRSRITTPVLYTGLHTDELRYFVRRLHKKFPNKQIHLAGFSFGGLVIANYLAEEGDKSIITSAITCSSPWNLADSTFAITKSLSGKYLFEPALRFFLMNMIKVNLETLKQDPEFDVEDYYRFKKEIKSTIEFDNKYSCKLAGFPTATTYHLAASPVMRMMKIKTPTLIINAKDDPMVSTDYPYLEVEANPYLYMATSDLGGHYAFINPKGEFWFSDVIKKFVDSFNTQIDKDKNVDDGGYNVYQTQFKEKIELY
ncbi:hypothetical protein CANARDRAFT_5922 [[Candida] arabinofermentans NRRL YB-2248]|uniref:AB hydrolase-1 domain-containing protein n=1 Tax=[Candida] arabinofermentans NRRL YB-2248 TaxID=983967 RepID=A0A1E4T6K1_9ASCO|nr:hypothetical protein CANARDRAFT_5922 [[Candida] arabinofermentans NRRL YB-2248]